jgi:Rhodopirellula transposase DDE domain
MSVGSDHDTAAFAVNAIGRWWQTMGAQRYPDATRLLVTADAGGSNGYRNRLWKVELARLAAETGLEITVYHYPPGTSKWNTIEHRLFCYISQTWREKPLTSRLAVVELIGATTTKTGLKVACELDPTSYRKGIKVSDAEMESLALTGDAFHPEWNYTIAPRQPNASVILR